MSEGGGAKGGTSFFDYDFGGSYRGGRSGIARGSTLLIIAGGAEEQEIMVVMAVVARVVVQQE